MTKILVDIGERKKNKVCTESITHYHDSRCPLLSGGGIAVYTCKLDGRWLGKESSGLRLPLRSDFCLKLEREAQGGIG